MYQLNIMYTFAVYKLNLMCTLTPHSGLYGVGKAAINPPALVVLSHKPEGSTRDVAWVGKGIVYDTGGLSIKGKVGTGTRQEGRSPKLCRIYTCNICRFIQS